MNTVGVTGSNGFLGWHLRCHLHQQGFHNVVCAPRSVFDNTEQLEKFVSSCNVVVHIAGVNRADTPEQIRLGNVEPAIALAEALEKTQEQRKNGIALIYANTTQTAESGEYGKSKHEAAEILGQCQKKLGGTFINIRFPHLFGEFGKPNYNSAVHTFAHKIMHNETPQVIVDAELNLLHAQDAAKLIVDNFESQTKTLEPNGRKMKVSEVLGLMFEISKPYLERGSMPNFTSKFDLQLFNTMKSQLDAKHFPVNLTAHSDERGSFYEVLRSFGTGQTSLSTTNPGVTRGGHYHKDKIERFVVISGAGQIRLRKLMTNEVITIDVDGDEPALVDIPTLTTHDITNVGTTTLTTLFWSNDHFDPENPDTYLALVDGNESAL